MNKQQVIDLMQSSKSEAEWNANCTAVKKACGGYPSFWHEAIVKSGLMEKTLGALGVSSEIRDVSISRAPIQNIYGRPTMMPYLGKGQHVVGVYNQGLGEKDQICKTLEDMQSLYDSYAQGMALSLSWCIVTHN